jgi:hypothetical protein
VHGDEPDESVSDALNRALNMLATLQAAPWQDRNEKWQEHDNYMAESEEG